MIALALVLSAGLVHAASITTRIVQGGTGLTCTVIHATRQNAKVQSAVLRDVLGAPMSPGKACGDTLDPKETCVLIVTANDPVPYCDVVGSSKLRVGLIAFGPSGATAALAGTK